MERVIGREEVIFWLFNSFKNISFDDGFGVLVSNVSGFDF